MVSVTQQDVADAMHLSGTGDLPNGVDMDIATAEDVVEEQVVPYSSMDAEMHNRIATYVAAAFIQGTEGTRAISSINRASATVSFDAGDDSPESSDFWERAKALDTTGRLGQDTVAFRSIG